ncbi:MAG: GntR family transcriptional regulator [Anaerolineaceae bacterium]|nr:GntR family transcriptional regulator [Anaerolineaceae bacterium]
MSINRNSAIPIYRQLYLILRSQIEANEYRADDILPTEEQLAEQYAVSRVTIRKALQILVDDGLIVRQAGKGTFVYPQKIEENLYSLQGFAEMMASDYPTQVMEILNFEVIQAGADLATSLTVPADDKILRIKRRHKVEQRPVAYAIIYLPFEVGKLFTPDDVETTPIYTLLARKAGITIGQATQRIAAIAANHEIAEVLGIAVGSPVLTIKRVTYSTEQKPIEYIQLYYPGNQHELVMELYRDGSQNTVYTRNHADY